MAPDEPKPENKEEHSLKRPLWLRPATPESRGRRREPKVHSKLAGACCKTEIMSLIVRLSQMQYDRYTYNKNI